MEVNMSEYPIANDLGALELPLEKIFLDPNNPRFVGAEWDYIDDKDIDDVNIQLKAEEILIDKFQVQKLRSNMEYNGYLPIDRIIVRKIKADKYVVLEGNRRICAAKLIIRDAKKKNSISKEILTTFKKIPCLLYTGEMRNAAWIFQGLRHISGVIEWSSFNKAKLLVEQMEEEEIKLTEVGQRFGLTAFGAGQWVRGYKAFLQAKEKTDYMAEIDERSYPYFQEIFGRSNSSLREWLEWNDDQRAFKNEINLNEFVGWLYPKEGDEDGVDKIGDWNKRFIPSAVDLRNISFLIRETPELFQEFRQKKDLDNTYSLAVLKRIERKSKDQADIESSIFETITNCRQTLDNIPLRMLKKTETKDQLKHELDELTKSILLISQEFEK